MKVLAIILVAACAHAAPTSPLKELMERAKGLQSQSGEVGFLWLQGLPQLIEETIKDVINGWAANYDNGLNAAQQQFLNDVQKAGAEGRLIPFLLDNQDQLKQLPQDLKEKIHKDVDSKISDHVRETLIGGIQESFNVDKAAAERRFNSLPAFLRNLLQNEAKKALEKALGILGF